MVSRGGKELTHAIDQFPKWVPSETHPSLPLQPHSRAWAGTWMVFPPPAVSAEHKPHVRREARLTGAIDPSLQPWAGGLLISLMGHMWKLRLTQIQERQSVKS